MNGEIIALVVVVCCFAIFFLCVVGWIFSIGSVRNIRDGDYFELRQVNNKWWLNTKRKGSYGND